MRFLFFILIILSPLSFAHAQTTTVRCPTQPRNQHRINLIFFSFSEKSANLKSYIPRNLVLVDSQYLKNGPRCLTSQSYAAFVAMNDALIAETGESLVISSAWRSTATQAYFLRTRPAFAALPGRSEHQLGTTVDLDVKGAPEEQYFGDSNAYKWMALHAAKYGFVQSFNTEGEGITGTPNEPWHWRFVGKTIATKVTNEKRDINEYLLLRAQLKKVTQ